MEQRRANADNNQRYVWQPVRPRRAAAGTGLLVERIATKQDCK